MKILITGSTGLLGQALVKRLSASCDVVGISRHPAPRSGNAQHVVCDLTDARATERLVKAVEPEVVIHTQALSDVDQCELNPQQAMLQNVQTVEHLCHALQDRRAVLIAMSTDYVFDGAKTSPYDELDEPKPLSVYGRSKLAGERIALDYPHGCVVRPSTLFGPGRTNFCDMIVHRVRRHEPVEAFVDQTTSPTYTEDLAEGIQALIQAMAGRGLTMLPRLYHMTNAGQCTRAVFAQQALQLLGQNDSLLRRVQMQDHRRPAPRPAYCALTSRYLFQAIGRTLRPWDEALSAYLRQQHWTN